MFEKNPDGNPTLVLRSSFWTVDTGRPLASFIGYTDSFLVNSLDYVQVIITINIVLKYESFNYIIK